jgi:hypothetical protein
LLNGDLEVLQSLADRVQFVEAQLRECDNGIRDVMQIIFEIITNTRRVKKGRLSQMAALLLFVALDNGKAIGDGPNPIPKRSFRHRIGMTQKLVG